jgi:hypothetical protein
MVDMNVDVPECIHSLLNNGSCTLFVCNAGIIRDGFPFFTPDLFDYRSASSLDDP